MPRSCPLKTQSTPDTIHHPPTGVLEGASVGSVEDKPCLAASRSQLRVAAFACLALCCLPAAEDHDPLAGWEGNWRGHNNTPCGSQQRRGAPQTVTHPECWSVPSLTQPRAWGRSTRRCRVGTPVCVPTASSAVAPCSKDSPAMPCASCLHPGAHRFSPNLPSKLLWSVLVAVQASAFTVSSAWGTA